jgi:hypothetical protein
VHGDAAAVAQGEGGDVEGVALGVLAELAGRRVVAVAADVAGPGLDRRQPGAQMMTGQRLHDVAEPVSQPRRQPAIEHGLAGEGDVVGAERKRAQPDRQRYRAGAVGDGRREREGRVQRLEPRLAFGRCHDALGLGALKRRIVRLRSHLPGTAERDRCGEGDLSTPAPTSHQSARVASKVMTWSSRAGGWPGR